MRKGSTSAKKNVAEFVQLLVNHGVRHVVVSPGSRNAPLVIACDEHPDIDCSLIHDERSAGFVAMGMTLELQKPVAVLCTSGSAVANYLPAVVEAYYQELPLVVISADRPKEWINHGDGQTIMQEGVFGKHILSELSLDDQTELPKEEVEHMLTACVGSWSGPIHFNFAFTEPLYETKEHVFPEVIEAEAIQVDLEPDLTLFRKAWEKADKKLVLVGQMLPDENFRNQLAVLSNDPSVIVLTENTANVSNRNYVSCIDRTIEGLKESDKDFMPDLLLTFGGAVVSKKIKRLLRSWPIENHFRVSTSFQEMDTYRHLTECLEIRPSKLLKNINSFYRSKTESGYQALWKGRDYLHEQKLEEYLERTEFCDFKVFQEVLSAVPDYVHLHLGNSSVVRYAQLFNPFPFVRYSCNRGTSGIDGSLSTAVGAAMASPDTMHLCILGDVSFLYDSNALWNMNFPSNLRIVVINNGGGGIFKIIPGPSSTKQLNKYFFAQNEGVQLSNLLKNFGITSIEVNDLEALQKNMFDLMLIETENTFLSLVVNTVGQDNEHILNSFFSILH